MGESKAKAEAAKALNESRAIRSPIETSRVQKKKRFVPSIANHDTHDRAVELDAPAHQWGNIFVSWLGQTASPSKPRRWMTCVSAKQPLVPPRMARSVEEATSLGFDELGEYVPSEFIAGSKQGVSFQQASRFESIEEAA